MNPEDILTFTNELKEEMELSKRGIELFLILPHPQSKNFFYKMFLTFKNDTKTCFTKRYQHLKTNQKLVLKTGNRIIQTGNGIISPTS